MASARYPLSPRNARVAKLRSRKRLAAMEMSLHHAFIARLEETIFCPTSTVAGTAPLLLPALLDTHTDREDIILPDADAADYTDSASRPAEVLNARDWAAAPPLQPPHDLARHIQDQRNGLHEDLLPPRRTGLPEPTWDPPPSLVSELLGIQIPSHLQFLPRHGTSARNAHTSSHSTHGQSLPDGHADLHSQLNSDLLREEAASTARIFSQANAWATTYVDDGDDGSQRRSKDFVAFMDEWQGRDEQACPRKTAEPAVSFTPPEPVIREDVISTEKDIQGIRWHPSGPGRRAALQARRRFRSRYHWSHSPPSDDTHTHDDETQYRFKCFTPKHRANTSHYQLRNMLTSTSHGDVFYASNDKVLRTALTYPDSMDTIMDLTRPTTSASAFRITCLASSPSASRQENLVFAGGFNGEYAFANLSAHPGPRYHNGWVSHAVNGVVTHISTNHDRISGLLRATFSCNDRRLRILDVTTKTFVGVQEYPHAINCSALAPDSRLRMVVGDSNEALITDSEKGDVLVRLKEHADNIFACAWGPDGRYVATGAEDGRVAIWDARNWQRPVSTKACFMSCARSVHFSEQGSLLVAEEDDIVSVYNPQQWELGQTIRFFGSIAGITLVNGGEEVVVANTDRTVGGLLTFERTTEGYRAGSHTMQYEDDSPKPDSWAERRTRRLRRIRYPQHLSEFDLMI